jgi:lipopolysaccharide export system protein LptA
MQMFSRATMKRGQDEVRGNYISYDAATEFFQVIGGGSKAATANNPEGRVRAVLQPKPKDPPAAAPPAALQPADKLRAPRDYPGAGKK